MDEREQQQDLPARDEKEIEQEAKKSRKELDAVPKPGTDTLHEGP